MWSLLPRKLKLTLIIGTGVLVAWSYDALFAYITGSYPNLLSVISLTVTAVGSVLVLIFELSWKWLWQRWPFLQTRTFPDLNGVWTGTLTSTWVNPETGRPPGPISTTVTIRQGLFLTTLCLETGESKSHSTRVFLEPHPDRGCYRVWYSYNNDPQALVRHRSSPHEGVAFLEVDFGRDPHHLTGRYYTERKATGDLDLRHSMLRRGGSPATRGAEARRGGREPNTDRLFRMDAAAPYRGYG